MKSTGIVRPVDELGRIVLPKELRSTLSIDKKDTLEIYTEDNLIILKKNVPYCLLCGDSKVLVKFHDKLICRDCIEDIRG